MNRDIATVGFILLMAFLMLFCFDSCDGAATKNYFAYSTRSFEAEVAGIVDTVDLRAKISYQINGEDENITVTFLSPSSLEGIVVTMTNGGQAMARYKDIILDGEAYTSLVRPFLCLVHKGEYRSIEKREDGTTVINVKNNEKNLTYAFDGGVLPRTVTGNISGREIKLEILSAFFAEQGELRLTNKGFNGIIL